MRHLVFAIISLAAGIPLAAIASSVLPTRTDLTRRAVVAIGIAAGIVGLVGAIPGRGVQGPIVTAVAAVVFVLLYDRFHRR